MKPGDPVYVRYIGHIRHWSREVFQAPIAWVGAQHFTVEIKGQASRFERSSLRHDNRSHPPTYQLFLTKAAYEQEMERAELLTLMSRTDFGSLSVEKQRAIKAIIQA